MTPRTPVLSNLAQEMSSIWPLRLTRSFTCGAQTAKFRRAKNCAQCTGVGPVDQGRLLAGRPKSAGAAASSTMSREQTQASGWPTKTRAELRTNRSSGFVRFCEQIAPTLLTRSTGWEIRQRSSRGRREVDRRGRE